MVYTGASFSIKNAVGKCAFEYISDFEEWIQSGLFSPDIVSQLRGKEQIRDDVDKPVGCHYRVQAQTRKRAGVVSLQTIELLHSPPDLFLNSFDT